MRPRAPPPLVRIGLGKGGGAPLSFSLSLSFLPPLFPCWKPTRNGIPSRNPTWGAPHEGRPASPLLLYIRGQGHPRTHKLTIVLAVCGAPLHRFPPRSYRCSA